MNTGPGGLPCINLAYSEAMKNFYKEIHDEKIKQIFRK